MGEDSQPTDTAARALIPLGFLILMSGLAAIGPFSVDMYLPSMPTIQAHYRTDTASVQATMSAYFVGLSLGQLAIGPLMDRFGRRPPLLAGLSAYVVASLVCTVAPSIHLLLGARVLQALGACTGTVASRAILRDLYTPRDMARVLSLIMLVMGIAPIIAPMMGSALYTALGWQSIFAFLAIYGAAILAAVGLRLPETLAVRSGALSPLGVLRAYLGLLPRRRFMGYALAGGLAQAGMFAYIASSSFVFLEVYGLTAGQYALLFGTNAAGLIGASQLNTRLLRRASPEQILPWVVGLFAVSGAVMLGTVATRAGGLWGLAVPLFFAIAALGLSFPNTTAAAMGPVADRAGLAAALLGTIQFALAGFTSYLSGRLFDGTALPMAAVIAASGLLSALCLLALRLSEGPQTARP